MTWSRKKKPSIPAPEPAPATPVDTVPDAITFAQSLDFHPDPTQAELLRCESPQVILNCCRQWGKSTVAAIKAVYRARFHPKSLVIVASPTERQSAEFILKARALVSKLGPTPRGDGHNRASLRLPNGSRIIGLPGKEGNIRGYSGVNLLIIDEAARVPDELYKALRPMLTVNNGDVWLLSTPKGKLGFFHENWEYGAAGTGQGSVVPANSVAGTGPGSVVPANSVAGTGLGSVVPANSTRDAWTRFRVPATDCARISAERLQIERTQMDDAWFRQEYLCEFLATDRQMFDSDLVRDSLGEEDPWNLRTDEVAFLPFPQMLSGNPVFLGLDLGQRRDYTAITVIEREDQRNAWMSTTTRALRIRHLERVPLGTSYTAVVERVRQLVHHPLLIGRCRVVADATGLGGPVVDLLRAARLDCPLTPVTITSGDRPHSSGEHWHVPKRDLLSGLLVLLESGTLKIPHRLAQAATLIRELNQVEIHHSPAGNLKMGAGSSGQHDDLVIATALACWKANRKEITFGTRNLVY